MKKTILILAAVSMVFASADAQLFKAKAKKAAAVVAPVKVFTNDVDSMSYALGINVGTDFAKNLKGIPGGKSNIDLIIKGFNTAMKGDSALMKPEVATEYFRNFISKAQAKDVEVKKAAGEKFLAENKTKDGVTTTVLVAKDGPKPAATDTVKVHYTGTLLDGTKFDSSVDRGEPVSFPLNQVIKGWTEGVQLMSVGSKYKFFIPYDLGYGAQAPQGSPIPAYATLTFEVELLDIKKFKEATPKVEVKEIAAPKAVKGSKKSKK
jgi:FKBP-type peptidyl-prolyl cis-trans isomerase